MDVILRKICNGVMPDYQMDFYKRKAVNAMVINKHGSFYLRSGWGTKTQIIY